MQIRYETATGKILSWTIDGYTVAPLPGTTVLKVADSSLPSDFNQNAGLGKYMIIKDAVTAVAGWKAPTVTNTK